MKVSDLKPLEKNPFKSKGDAQIKRIAKSIQEFEHMMEIRRIYLLVQAPQWSLPISLTASVTGWKLSQNIVRLLLIECVILILI